MTPGAPASPSRQWIWRPLAARARPTPPTISGKPQAWPRSAADLAEAQRFYEQAARAGHLEAQTSLGLLLFQNNDRAAALRWLKQASEAGEPRATLVYGTALFNGDGVPEDRIRAYALVSRSAAQGLAPARTTLVEMDQIIPLADRQKGIALAKQLATASTPPVARPVKPAPVNTASAPDRRAAAHRAGRFRCVPGAARAFRDVAPAQRLFSSLGSRLNGARMTLVPSGTMTRLQVGPYPTRAAAAAACAASKPTLLPVAAN